jgi:serine/threonine protein kinase
MAKLQKIGKYQIVEELGRGGMSIVYRAMDTALKRPVALKVLDPRFASDPMFERRFFREAKVAASLRHSNILAIYDVEKTKEYIYIAMEFIEGGTLADLLSRRNSPLGIDEAVRIVVQVADALEYAHSNGVIHRDVKPSNILLTKEHKALLTDFGIAKITESLTAVTTSTGTFIGTPRYMAPEQIDQRPVDPTSDIYSLGVVLYEMLTSKNPFSGDSALSIVYAVLSQPPVTPRTYNPLIPPNLEKVVLRALAKKPADRYQSASEFAAALESSIGEISIEDSWRGWENTIITQLLGKGQVEASFLKDIPEQFRAYALERFATSHPDASFTYSKEQERIILWDSELIINVVNIWDSIVSQLDKSNIITRIRELTSSDSTNRQIIAKIEAFARDFADCLGVPVQNGAKLAIQPDHFVTGLLLDTSTPFGETKLPIRLPCIFFMRPELEETHLTHLRGLLSEQVGPNHRVALLFVFGDSSAVKRTRVLLERKVKQVHAYDFIVLGRDDLIQVLLLGDKQKGLRQLVLKHVDLNSVSPFVTTGPTSDTMFFGREKELRAIAEQVDTASYTIIAGRRFGKTSILGRLHRVRLPAAGFRVLYHDCSTTPTYKAFLATSIRDWQPESPPDGSVTFSDLLQSPPADKRLVLLLDEADKLIPADQTNGWPLFNALRALANSGRTQVVLSGERTLREALRDSTGPLFNFANEILLGPLDFRSVEELVTRPMKQLEIELEDEKAIVNHIWTFTSGHPNVVQRLCRRLIERLNEQGVRRVTLDDVNAVIENPAFQRDDFLSTYWEAATSLEKIISLLMADDKSVRTLRTVRQALGKRCNLQPKAREVDDALQRLVDLRSILKRTPTGYEFAVEAFPRVVAGTMTLDDMLEILTEEYQEEGE